MIPCPSFAGRKFFERRDTNPGPGTKNAWLTTAEINSWRRWRSRSVSSEDSVEADVPRERRVLVEEDGVDPLAERMARGPQAFVGLVRRGRIVRSYRR